MCPVQTLAHKEGDTWVLNDPPPNKALELEKCQRYYYQSWTGDANTWTPAGCITKLAINGGRLQNTEFPVTMRVTPTITFIHHIGADLTPGVVAEWATGTQVPATAGIYNNNKSFVAMCNENLFEAGKTYAFHYIASADL